MDPPTPGDADPSTRTVATPERRTSGGLFRRSKGSSGSSGSSTGKKPPGGSTKLREQFELQPSTTTGIDDDYVHVRSSRSSPTRTTTLTTVSTTTTTTTTTTSRGTTGALIAPQRTVSHSAPSAGPTIVRGIPVVSATAPLRRASSSSIPQQLPKASVWRPPAPLSSNASVTSHGSAESKESTMTTSKKSLHKKKASLSQYQTTPITKHYELSKQILSAFDSHWSQQLWVTAYAVGLQFVETCLLEIPKHGYFYSDRHERERMESSLEAARVAHLLTELLQQDEVTRHSCAAAGAGSEPTAGVVPQGNLPHVQKLLALALEQIEQASSDQDHAAAADQQHAFAQARAQVEQDMSRQDQNTADDCFATTGDWIVCGTANYCGAGSLFMSAEPQTQPMSQASLGTAASGTTNASTSMVSPTKGRPPKPPATILEDTDQPPPPYHSVSTSSSTENDASLYQSILSQEALFKSFAPPPLHRAASTGSIQASEELLLEKALFLSGLEVSVATDVGYTAGRHCDTEQRIPAPPNEATRVPSAAILELATVANLYHDDFDALQRAGLVRLSFADTYQGRLPASTNGCTVIAPMLCIQHLMVELDDFYYDAGGDPGLSDSAITHVIDVDTPIVLLQLRTRLGLSEHAFLIPADAHDYLLENSQLTSDQFHTVVGGNILHDDHLTAFITALDEVTHRKLAATLFFHEHVVAILKLKRVDRHGTVSWWYDFIDSLPQKEMLRRSDESPHELCQRMGLLNGLSDEATVRENDMVALPKTARIRCLSADALTGVIRWYACSKFNDENMAYIDQYPWDDSTSDFDPRVFQAFIWGGASFSPKS